MEPRRGLVIRPIVVGRWKLEPDSYVWILSSHAAEREIEYRDQVSRVPRDRVLECPVSGPTLEQLRERDACFGLGADAFEVEHVDERYFVIQRCKRHGRRFLRDTRGTIALYDRVTLLDPEDSEDSESIWYRYHKMSDDWLNYAGRTL